MALFKRATVGKPGEWFYCLKHQKVEEGPECPAKDRFGPYGSREEAAHAMDTARDRNESWENDPRWRDRSAEDPEGPEGPDGAEGSEGPEGSGDPEGPGGSGGSGGRDRD